MDDPRHAPLYSIPECARYLNLPVSTVRRWLATPGSNESEDDKPLVRAAGSDPTALSFTNLVEIFVLSSLRRNRAAPTKEALKNALHGQRERDSAAQPNSTKAQLCLDRIEYDEDGRPGRLYPFTRGFGREDPRSVVIDPAVKFGRPVISGTGVRTSSVAKFVKAGDPISGLAEDYRVRPEHIEEALRYELRG